MANAVPITLPNRQKDPTRRNFLAAMTAPLMLAHVTDVRQAFARNTRPLHSPTVLPFVKDATEEELSAGASPRNFWSVVPTGCYGTDCDTGATYAALALDYMSAANSPQILQWSVFDMMKLTRAHSGIEVGFMSVFGRMATKAHGHRSLVEGATI